MNKDHFKVIAAIAFSLAPAITLADTLPLKDGAYLGDPQWCILYHHDELDFIDFEVDSEGRSFGFIEVGCLAYSIKKTR